MEHIIIALAAALVLVFAALMFKSRGNVSHKIDYEALLKRRDELERTKAHEVGKRK